MRVEPDTNNPLLTATWIDRLREPKSPPDPRYPLGIDVDLSARKPVMTCKITVRYPAPRCGYHAIKCGRCGFTALVTTSGRIDDPRTVQVPCQGART